MVTSKLELSRNAFASIPHPESRARIPDVEDAAADIRDCLTAGRGIAVLTAPAGLGKTVLCRRLQDELAERFCVILFPGGGLDTPTAFLQAVLCELDLPYRDRTEPELRLEFLRALRRCAADNHPLVLLFDEAHDLPEDVLEEIRAATNVIERGTPAARVLLSGQIGLEEKLTSHRLDALNQRIGCHVHLEPLSRQQSRGYVEQRLQAVGVHFEDLFQPDAVRTIAIAADGNPRCLDRLCDRALLLAGKSGREVVDDPAVRRALEELKQLPLHWNDPPPAKSEATSSEPPTPEGAVSRPPAIEATSNDAVVIEFGAEEDTTDAAVATNVADDGAARADGPAGTIEIGPTSDDDDGPALDAPEAECRAPQSCAAAEVDRDDGPATGSLETAPPADDDWEPVQVRRPLKRDVEAAAPNVRFGEHPPEHTPCVPAAHAEFPRQEHRPPAPEGEECVDDHYAQLLAGQQQSASGTVRPRRRAFEAAPAETSATKRGAVRDAGSDDGDGTSEPNSTPADRPSSDVAMSDDIRNAAIVKPRPRPRLVDVIPADDFCFDERDYDVVMPVDDPAGPVFNADKGRPAGAAERPAVPRPRSDLFRRLRRMHGGE